MTLHHSNPYVLPPQTTKPSCNSLATSANLLTLGLRSQIYLVLMYSLTFAISLQKNLKDIVANDSNKFS